MGQKLSSLRKKIRTAKKDALCERNFDESLSRRIGESKIDPIPASLLTLPSELIFEIADYLPPSSYMSLNYLCRRIRNSLGAAIEDILGDKVLTGRWKDCTSSIDMRNIQSLERLEWRSMLERDKKYPSLGVYCSQCLREHDRSQFSFQSLTTPSTERRCLGSAGRVWTCPHRSFSIEDLVGCRERSDAIICGNLLSQAHGSYQEVCSGVSHRAICSWWPIMAMPHNYQPSFEEVKEALGPLNAPICPHLRLNNACIASDYVQECQHLQGVFWGGSYRACQCWKCSSHAPLFTKICDFCDAEINFGIKSHFHFDDGPDILALYIGRKLKSRWHDCTDRDWVCHVADPADFEEYEEAWYAANAECFRRTGCDIVCLERHSGP